MCKEQKFWRFGHLRRHQYLMLVLLMSFIWQKAASKNCTPSVEPLNEHSESHSKGAVLTSLPHKDCCSFLNFIFLCISVCMHVGVYSVLSFEKRSWDSPGSGVPDSCDEGADGVSTQILIIHAWHSPTVCCSCSLARSTPVLLHPPALLPSCSFVYVPLFFHLISLQTFEPI